MKTPNVTPGIEDVERQRIVDFRPVDQTQSGSIQGPAKDYYTSFEQTKLQQPHFNSAFNGESTQRILKIRRESANSTTAQIHRHKILQFASEGNLQLDPDQFSTEALQAMSQEGLINLRPESEIEWLITEIETLKGYIASVQDQMYPLRRDSIKLTKEILEETAENSTPANKSPAPPWKIIFKGLKGCLPPLLRKESQRAIDQYEVDKTEILRQKIIAMTEKRVKIGALKADLKLFEDQIRQYRSTLNGYYRIGSYYIKLTAEGRRELYKICNPYS